MAEETTQAETSTIELAAELTIAWLGNPNVRVNAEDVPAFLKAIHGTLNELSDAGGSPLSEATPEHIPTVSPRSSIKPDSITCLECGSKQKTLKRHLRVAHDLTPAEYRERYGLKSDYPMVAPNYAQQRREMAVRIGLGRKAGQKTPATRTVKAG